MGSMFGDGERAGEVADHLMDPEVRRGVVSVAGFRVVQRAVWVLLGS